MRKGRAAGIGPMLLIALIVTGCDPAPQAAPEPSPTPSATEAADKPRFERLPRVKPPVLESKLTAKNIRGCLYRERLTPADYAGLYTSPEELVSAQVETSRSVDFDRPDVDLLEGRAFDREVVGRRVQPPVDERVTTKLIAWALGVTERGVDINYFFGGNDAGLVAGFYDPSDGQIVIQREGKMDGEYVVMAHEFAHAAVDQAYGLPRKKIEPIIDDTSLGISALIEGDASLSELRVLSRLSPPKAVRRALDAHINFSETFKKERKKGVPHLLLENSLFPYRWGLAFTCSVFKSEGWDGVNRAYKNPPTSTAQIMFPERFFDREDPVEPQILDKPGVVWVVRDRGKIGAAHLKALFEAPGDKEKKALSKPLSRAASWAGGTYKVWTAGGADDEYVVGASFVEHEDYEGVLCSSLREWYRAAFKDAKAKMIDDGVMQFDGATQDAVLSCQGPDIALTFAPNLELAGAPLGLKIKAKPE